MQTVVLATARGTGLRPLTDRRPKSMLPVAGRPLLDHTLAAAAAAGASSFVLVVAPGDGAVREYVGTEYADVPVAYAEQTGPRGTGDAVECLDDAPFAVLNGETLTGSLDGLYRAGPAVGAARVDDPTQYAVLELDGDRVTDVVESPSDPATNVVDAGAYAFPAAARSWLDAAESERGELAFGDVLSRVCETVDVTAVEFDRWLEVGRSWDLLAANEWKLSEVEPRIEGTIHADAELHGDVRVASDASVRSGVVIEGPAYVDEGATVGPNAYVRGATYLGPGAKVGHAVEVKNSVLMAGATAGHLAYVGDSILGRDTNLGAGTKVANLRHDGEAVRATAGDEVVSTGRRKFGVVLGDEAKTGINTSLNAGVTLPTGGATGPGETVLRDPDD